MNETYLPKMNAKFSHPAAAAVDAHITPGDVDLSDILCLEYERTVGNEAVELVDLVRDMSPL